MNPDNVADGESTTNKSPRVKMGTKEWKPTKVVDKN